MQPPVQVLEVGLQVLPVCLPRHSIDSRGGSRLAALLRRLHTVDSDVVQERCEPHPLVSLCDLTHVVQRM